MSRRNGYELMPKKRDAYKAILRFLIDGDVKLKVEEEIILKRLEHADLLMKQKAKTEQQMVDELVEKFNISIHTAKSDLYKAQNLFAKSRQINKKYLAHHHLERIDRDIQIIRSVLFTKDTDGKIKVPDSKEMQALAKLYETYTYTLNSLPEESNEDKQPPPIFQFILAPGQVIEKPMDLKNAINKADIILKEKNGIYEPEVNLENRTEKD